MNKIILLLIVVVAVGAAAFSGFFTPPKPKGNTPAAFASCVDRDPPSTTETVSFNSETYNLIKLDAWIPISKFGEMNNVGSGQTNDGKTVNIYKLMSTNNSGEPNSSFENIVFALKEKKDDSVTFDIYLRASVVKIPDFIINCTPTGGQIAIVGGEEEKFPPSAFNKKEINGTGAFDPELKLAYVRSQKPPTTGVPVGSKFVGNLNVSGKGNLPLQFHLGTIYLMYANDAYEYLGTDKEIDFTTEGKKSLQLKKVTFVTVPTYSWYTPFCKPAIYLYPTKRENVNVKVNTTGFFTLTIPDYNKSTGWDVVANPDGTVETAGNKYPYLYYESKVPDSKINKPDKGFVVLRNELSQLFDNILPKLGLNQKESKEFKDYWEKALPSSPYYFVGVMDQKSINQIEPLDINPSPDSLIRVRLYFEMLDKPINVDKPIITTPERNGFTVVEWGGMVKTDKDHPFTCSQ